MPTTLLVLFLLSALFITTISCQNPGCTLLYSDFPHKEPVFYRLNFTVIEPNNQAIKLKYNEEVIIACPGAKNTLLINGEREVKGSCVKDETLEIDRRDYKLSRLNCSKEVVGEVNVTGLTCGNNRGVIKNIGYSLSNKKFNTLFSVCYEDKRGEAVYAQHVIYGSAIKHSKKDSSRPGFKTTGLGPQVAADVSYKQITQKVTFSSLLGSDLLARKYIHNKSYFARGHLAPDGDFIYVSAQHSSYFYINTIPQWQVINNGNWKSIEFAVRHIAGDLKKDIQVWTGGFQTLKLPDTKGDLKEIFLVPLKKLLPVPKYVWKIIYEPQSNLGMAFVTINNPFIKTIKPEDILCEDICEQSGFNTPTWKNPSKGYTFCCNINDLKKIINTIPFIPPNKPLKVTVPL